MSTAVVLTAVGGVLPGAGPGAGWTAAAPGAVLLHDRPPPRRADSAVPLGRPLAAPTPPGPHAFMALQADGVTPVAYDPCRPLPYVVNERTAPAGAAALLAEAIGEIERVTGLRFLAEGTTSEPARSNRAAYQPEVYGRRWAPILIGWSDPAELAELGGAVAGIGGSTWVSTGRGGPDVFVSGVVLLDGPQIAGHLLGPFGERAARRILLHELGHLVGLEHVDDPQQLMHANGRQADLQTGDIAGLVQLGSGACVRKL